MSKTFAGICVALLSLILVVQVVTLLVNIRPKIAVVPSSASANLAGPDAQYDSCWMFWGTDYCNPYRGFGGGGGSSTSGSFGVGSGPKITFPYSQDNRALGTVGTSPNGTPRRGR